MARARPFIVTIDVEPDELFLTHGQPGYWLGFGVAVAMISEFREQWRHRSPDPIRLSWKLRMDNQIEEEFGDAAWIVSHHPTEFGMLADVGDEIGLHIHPFRLDDAGAWVADFSDQRWVSECVAAAVMAFEASLAATPCTASMGHNWQSNATLALFHELGITIDMSLEHGTHKPDFYDGVGRFLGSRPSFEAVPQNPYRPSHSDFLVPDANPTERPWIIPLASIPGPAGQRKFSLTEGREPLARLLEDDALRCSASALRSSDFLDTEKVAGVRDALGFLAEDPRVVLATPSEALALAGLTSDG